MDPALPKDARPTPEDARPVVEDARPALEDAIPRPDSRVRTTCGRRALDAVVLLGPICLFTAATVPTIGVAILAAAWAGNTGAGLLALLAGLVMLTLVIALASYPGRALIHSGGTLPGRLRWAAGVCLLGTLLIAVGGYLWRRDQAPFGSGPTRIWMIGAAYALAAAARSRPSFLRKVALAGFCAAGTLTVSLVIISAAHQGTGAPWPAPQAIQSARIPSNLLLVGNTPAGYQPVAGSISEEGNGSSPFLATYTCVSNCPPDPSPGQAPSIMFTAAPAGRGDFSVYEGLCGPNPDQGYVCSSLGPDMWRAAVPSSPTVYQTVIYEHGVVEFTLQAPPTMDPQLLRAYMLSIHRASNAELVSLLRGYPNYS